MTEKEVRKKLYAIEQLEPNTIKAYVAHEALLKADVLSFFKNIGDYGSNYGPVFSLSSYRQTHEFFDHYYEDIEIIRHEFGCDSANILTIPYDLKNSLAWFAFEQTAHAIAKELNLN